MHEWFQNIIGTKCKLVKMEDNNLVIKNFLLLNQASINDLNGRLNENYNYSRFRPNFLVDLKPYIEDTLSNIIFNKYLDNTFTLYDKCTRCGSVNINPDTGIKWRTIINIY